jgi:hypothetical protein
VCRRTLWVNHCFWFRGTGNIQYRLLGRCSGMFHQHIRTQGSRMADPPPCRSFPQLCTDTRLQKQATQVVSCKAFRCCQVRISGKI